MSNRILRVLISIDGIKSILQVLCCTIPPFQIHIAHTSTTNKSYEIVRLQQPPSLIRRGEILMIGFDVIDNWWDVKLKAMNKDKVG